jgi:hypothetical protein
VSTHRCLQDIRQICYFFPYHQFFAWLAKLLGDAAEEPGSSAISATGACDLAASHDIVAVTGHSGFPSSALRRLLEIIHAEYGEKKSSADRVSHTETSR